MIRERIDGVRVLQHNQESMKDLVVVGGVPVVLYTYKDINNNSNTNTYMQIRADSVVSDLSISGFSSWQHERDNS